MKIVLVSSFFEAQARGGAAVSVRLLAYGLVKRGIKVVVITTHPRRHAVVEHAGDLTVYRFYPWNLYWVGDKNRQPVWKKALWQLMDVWNPHAFWVVRRILEQEQPDIVHVSKLRGISPAVWAAASSAGSIPVAQTCRDYELMSPEGTLAGRVGSWAQKGARFLRPYQWIRARFSRTVAAVTAPSRYTLEMLTSRGFFPQAFKQVVPNSHGLTLKQLDLTREKMVSHPASKDRTVRLLYLGRLERIKGVDLLCAGFDRCATRFPNLHLGIAGWGTQESALQERYGKHSQITFHGPVFGENKARLLAESDALVVPSVWPEVFGIVIAEAYVYGKPVIAAQVGGIPEIVEDGITGFLVPPGDVDALTGMLCRVAEDPAGVGRMAPACFEAARRYGLETMMEKYISLYEQVLE